MLADNFRLLSRYNQWMNNNLFDCAEKLDSAVLNKEQGAFFGSILGTLNHLMVADVLWLQRFALHPLQFQSLDFLRTYPRPTALNQILHTDLATMRTDRTSIDKALIALCVELTDPILNTELNYQDTKGNPHKNTLAELLQHVFNHQTHHRGQATTLFNQNGIDVGVTDLMYLPRQ